MKNLSRGLRLKISPQNSFFVFLKTAATICVVVLCTGLTFNIRPTSHMCLFCCCWLGVYFLLFQIVSSKHILVSWWERIIIPLNRRIVVYPSGASVEDAGVEEVSLRLHRLFYTGYPFYTSCPTSSTPCRCRRGCQSFRVFWQRKIYQAN